MSRKTLMVAICAIIVVMFAALVCVPAAGAHTSVFRNMETAAVPVRAHGVVKTGVFPPVIAPSTAPRLPAVKVGVFPQVILKDPSLARKAGDNRVIVGRFSFQPRK